MSAVKEDIRDFDNFEWQLYSRDFPGVPLKHFLDNYGRYGKIPHDAGCPTRDHTTFFTNFVGPLCNNRIESVEPSECPAYPKGWNQWHDEFDLDRLRKMPLKTSFQFDVINYVKDPAPMQPKQTKNLLTF